MALPIILILSVCLTLDVVYGQETAAPSTCYGGGSIATSVILTFILTLLLVGVIWYIWYRRQKCRKGTHLILESDPEQGRKAEYAFDNPGFKDTTLVTATEKSSKIDANNKPKWTNWAPLSGLHLKSSEKKKPMDDSNIENQVKIVALKSQDFTGLGFNICGNMREGIYIRDILHRGPAFESGKLSPGDRINSVTISFEHMVYEDAMNILSYASPYEVIIEAKSGKSIPYTPLQGQSPVHPIFRSSSLIDLYHTEKTSKKRLFGDDHSSSSNYSSLQKSRSNMTTLERKESKSPRPAQPKPRKMDRSPQKITPETLKTHLELRMSQEELRTKERLGRIDADMQKTESKGQKFGVRVLPVENLEKSPKILEQNQNNYNIERNMEEITIQGIDEVDANKLQPPQVKKREKKSPEQAFQRNDSGIKRDKDGIPLEIPDHMLGAAVAARRNRKSSVEKSIDTDEESGGKTKTKAPSPPRDIKLNFGMGNGKTKAFEDLSGLGTADSSITNNHLRYGSDSEDETGRTLSSVNTIELNASDITIHQTEDHERKARKTASTGDLSKMKKVPRSNTGTLERAQSLDITDTSGPTLIKNTTYDARENLLIDREPRLSLILDGLSAFQKNCLKKSTEWGHLEDAILNLNRDDEEWEQRRKSEPQFNAVMNRVIQIKRESEEIEILPDEIVRQYQNRSMEHSPPSIVNKIWPDDKEIKEPPTEHSQWKIADSNKSNDTEEASYKKRQQVPVVPERTFIGKHKSRENKQSKEQFEEKHEKETDEKRTETFETIVKVDGKEDHRMSPKNKSLLNLANIPNTNITVEYECIRPIPPKRERTPEKETVINLSNNLPITSFEKHTIVETCKELAKDRILKGEMIKDEWELNTSAAQSSSKTLVEEVMESYNQNQKHEVRVLPAPEASQIASNVPDESKSVGNLVNETADFIFNEKSVYEADINLPDDVKVSRNAFEVNETRKPIKVDENLISHVTVSENGGSNLHSLELTINNEPSELYTTALDSTIPQEGAANEVTVIVSRPDKITVKKIETSSDPVVEITENSFSKISKGIENIPVNISESKHISVKEGDNKHDYKVEITESKYSTFEVDKPLLQMLNKDFHIDTPLIDPPPVPALSESHVFKGLDDESPAISLTEIKPLEDESLEGSLNNSQDEKKTYITEIQVRTPGNATSEVTITPQNEDHLETAFEKYVKNFETKLETFEDNMQSFETNLDDFIKNEPQSIILEEKGDAEKRASKIQEIAEEQLKTLPEMRFTTSSYETDRKTPEKRHSFELLRSNFEKSSGDRSPPKRDSTTPPKSRIPISTTMKTPPTSPERRDSRNLENENEKAILELMSSSSIHSTPFSSKIKPPGVSSKNISVTSIRSSSKIPSGLPTLNSKPPIVPRRSDDGVSNNGGVESSFKQWVFNTNSNVGNISFVKDK
ncbi:hypothetical protein GWI33_012751 [Rhynchophorus ferrugineus]|uniref:PDZ domain-containing protein n=1 Tax=Rhynchophorus ferrugineus TaxID=354439 RepID=A0A834MLT5_RHYFE|nr:hypothetical protein GWI33_012751 [Rhynchophorus ferrugineus]